MIKEKTGAFVAAFLGMLAVGAVNAFFMPGVLTAASDIPNTSPLLVIFTAVSFTVGLMSAHSFSDRYGYQRVVMTGTAFIVTAFLALAFWGGNPIVTGFFPIVAVCGFGLVFPMVYTICIGWFPKRLALASGAMLALFFAGGAFFYFLSHFLLMALGEAGGMFVLGLAYFFVMSILLYFLQRAPADNIQLALKYGAREGLPLGQLIRVCIICLAFGIALMPISKNVDVLWRSMELSTNPATFISADITQNALLAGEMVIWFTVLGNVLGALLTGLVSDSLDKRVAVAGCGAIAIFSITILLLAKDYGDFIFCSTIVSMCWGSALCITLSMAAELFERHETPKVSGLLMSIYAFIIVLAIALRPLLKTVHVPLEITSRSEATANHLFGLHTLYTISIACCLAAVAVIVLWQDYGKSKKQRTTIS